MQSFVFQIVILLINKALSWWVSLTQEQILLYSEYLIFGFYILFYGIWIRFYIRISYKICIFFGGRNRYGEINKGHLISAGILFLLGLAILYVYLCPKIAEIPIKVQQFAIQTSEKVKIESWTGISIDFTK